MPGQQQQATPSTAGLRAFKMGGGGPVIDMSPLQKRLHTVPNMSPDAVAKAARATQLMDPIVRAERAAAEAKEAAEKASHRKSEYDAAYEVACKRKLAYLDGNGHLLKDET